MRVRTDKPRYASTRRAQPERVEQTHIVRTLRLLGAAVYTLGTVRKRGDHQGTMQSPGLPDLLAFLPSPRESSFAPRRLLCVECKAPGGRRSLAQIDFADRCVSADVDYICGTLDDVLAWLLAHRYLKPEHVPHYRQPPEVTP